MSSNLITVTEARGLILEAISPLPGEVAAIEHALGRALAEDVRAAGDVPPFPCSAMDGYAIVAGAAGRRLSVVGEARAGTPARGELGPGEAIRISTGAAVPAGATAVIPQENVTADADGIRTGPAVLPGENVREPGEDMVAGSAVLVAGTRLGPLELGAAVAAGADSVTVARRPRVAVLCTGDELRAPGEPLGPGEIHNSNAPMLTGLAAGAGALTLPAQRLPDDRPATEAGIAGALADCDLVIISGGVSVGPHDHVRPALEQLGVQQVFWSVALQPGKPTWFGRRADTFVFGLPGNPVSAVVTFSLFVSPALAALQGLAAPGERGGPGALSILGEAILGEDIRRNPRREQALRVRLARTAGETTAFLNRAQGSHVLTSLIGADALAMIPAGDGVLRAGTAVSLHPLAR